MSTRASTRREEPAIAESRPRTFLQAGQLLVGSTPLAISTILGSCVAVCLWDGEFGIGGMNHFLLPHRLDAASDSRIERWRFGVGAIDGLVDELTSRGARLRRLRSKIFGGACVLEAFQGQLGHLGERNVEIARHRLLELGIPLDAESVGGNRGRKVIFHTDDGTAWVKIL